MATKKQIEAALGNLKDAVKIIEGLKSNRGFFNCLKAAVSVIGPVIKYVENASIELDIKGADKRKLAVDIIMRLVGPILPVWLPNRAVAELLPYLVDGAVSAVNLIIGKIWPKK